MESSFTEAQGEKRSRMEASEEMEYGADRWYHSSLFLLSFSSCRDWDEMWLSAGSFATFQSDAHMICRIYTQHVCMGRSSTSYREGTKSPIDERHCNKTRQWFPSATEAGSTGQKPTTVLWELGNKEEDRPRVGGSVNRVDLSSMLAL